MNGSFTASKVHDYLFYPFGQSIAIRISVLKPVRTAKDTCFWSAESMDPLARRSRFWLLGAATPGPASAIGSETKSSVRCRTRSSRRRERWRGGCPGVLVGRYGLYPSVAVPSARDACTSCRAGQLGGLRCGAWLLHPRKEAGAPQKSEGTEEGLVELGFRPLRVSREQCCFHLLCSRLSQMRL